MASRLRIPVAAGSFLWYAAGQVVTLRPTPGGVVRISSLISIVLPSLLLLPVWSSPAAASVSAHYIDSQRQLLSGSNADGRLGDLMLENDRVIIVIGAIGHTVQYAMSGGNVIDGASSTDRIDDLVELHTCFDNDWPRQAVYDWLEIVDDGSGGGPAIVRAAGVDSDDPSLEVVTEYSLAEGAEYLALTTTVTNRGASTVSDVELGDSFAWGACRRFSPGYGYDIAGKTTEPWVCGTAAEVSYGYVSPLGDVWGSHGIDWSDVNVRTVTLSPGDSALFSRDLVIAGRDVASVATVIHRIQGTPAALPLDEWQLRAPADENGITGEEIRIGSRTPSPIPGHGAIIPIGDTLTVIMRPLVNIPSIVRPGDTLSIECEADPATSGWSAELRHGLLQIPLEMLSSSYDPSTLWWTLSARVPSVSLYELYDLWVTADGGIVDCTRSAVDVIPEYKDDYYFIFIADTHLPTHKYNYQSGAGNDTSEVLDL